jgi:hypothetical protein
MRTSFNGGARDVPPGRESLSIEVGVKLDMLRPW